MAEENTPPKAIDTTPVTTQGEQPPSQPLVIGNANQGMVDYQAMLKSQVEKATKEAELKAQKELLAQTGYDSVEQLTQATAAYNKLVDAQKTEQQKAEEAIANSIKEIEEYKSQLARKTAENQQLIIDGKLRNYAQEFNLMLKVVPLIKYTIGEDGIKDDELRNIVKQFATDNVEFVVKASTSTVQTTGSKNFNSNTGKDKQRSFFVEKALANMTYLSMYNPSNGNN